MATAGGGSSLPTSSAYRAGGGAVGGKFQKRSFSKSRPTPYDRPRTALRNPNWISKLFIDPASKLVAASARRFFSSVFQKRLPPSSTPQLLPPPVANPDMNNGLQDSHIPKHSEAVQTAAAAAADSQSLIRKDSCGISELEQLLKQKSLTRHEIDRLTELLQSKAVDLPVKNDAKRDASSPLKPVKLKDFWLENTRNGEGSHQMTLTPGTSARVLGEDITAPAELAIAHVGRLPLKEPSSAMGFYGQAFQENRNLLCSLPSSPSSNVMSLEMTTTGQVNVPKNGFPIPRSRGRSAIYRMAGTSYLRMHQTTYGKASECNGSLLASPTLLKQNGEPGWKELGRKRSSAVLDDDVGSVGPIRRTRGRHGLVSHKASLPFGGKDVSDGVQQPLSPNHRGTEPDEGVEDTNKASTSYCHVPPKFREAASRILQNDEKMKQKEKSSESKLITDREKSPSKSTTYMLSGQALKSLQSADSFMLLEGTKNGEKLEDLSHRSLTGINGFNSQKQKRAEENDPKESGSDSTVSANHKLFSSVPSALPTVPLAQVTWKKHGFKMSVDEDFFDLDEDTYCNGPVAESSVEEREHKTPGFEQNPASAGNLILNKTPAFVETRKTHVEPVAVSENSSASVGGSVTSFAFPTLSFPDKPLQPVVHPPSPSFEKSKYVESSFASVSEVSTPKFSSRMEPIPSSSNRPGGASHHLTQVPGSAEHVESNLEEGAKGKGKPETQISVPFSSSISSSISASILPDPSNINNGPSTNLSTPAHTSATSSSLELPAFQFGSSNTTSTAVSLPVASNAEASPLKNEADKEANVTRSSMSPFDITSTAPLNTGSSLFGLGSRTDSSAGKSHYQGAGSVSGSTVVTVPEKIPSLFSSSTLTSTGIPGVASIAPFSSSTPATNLFWSGSSSGLSNSSSLSVLKSDASGSNISSTTFPSISTGFSGASAVSSISSSIPNNIYSFDAGSSGSAPVINASNNVATTSNAMPSTLSSSEIYVASTSGTSPTLFDSSSWQQTPKPVVAFGSTFNSSSSSNMFSFGASTTFTAPSTGSSTVFGAATTNTPASSFPTASTSPSTFTNFPSTFTVNSNNDQMNTEDSMAEDPVQSQPIVGPAPVFGQQSVPSTPPGFSFGAVVPPAAAPAFQLGGQQSQSPLFQGPGSFEINHGGNFSLGSGDDKSSRRFVKVNKNRHRKRP